MSDTVTLTVHPDSFDNRLTVEFSSIEYATPCAGNAGALVSGTVDGVNEAILVSETVRQIGQTGVSSGLLHKNEYWLHEEDNSDE